MRCRCQRCGQYDHTAADHDVAILGSKNPPEWYVLAFDVAGGLHSWYGPMRWASACAVVRCIETHEHVRSARINRRDVTMQGASSPLPDNWRDFLPTKSARSPRINRTHAKHVRFARQAT